MSRILAKIRGVARPSAVGLALFVTAALVYLAALYLGRTNGAECLYSHKSCFVSPLTVAGLGLAVVAALFWGSGLTRYGITPADKPMSRRLERGGVAMMLAIAATARLWQLGDIPRFLDYDTAQNGWIALTLWELLPTEGFRWVLIDWATGNETAYFYLVGISLKLFGVCPEALRLPAALVGVATVGAIYLLGRRLFSPAVGLWAGSVAAMIPGQIDHSRMAMRANLLGLFVALGLYFLARVLQYSDDRRRRWNNLLLCGVVLGVGLHSYDAFRLFPLVVAATLIWQAVRQRRAAWLLELGAVAAVAVLLTLPIALFAWQNPDAYFEHVSNSSMSHQFGSGQWLTELFQRARNTLVYFVFGMPAFPSATFLWVLPMLVVSLLYLCGLVGLVRGGRGSAIPGTRMILLTTVLLMSTPFLLTRFGTFAVRRYFGELVPFCLLAGVAGVGLVRRTRQLLGPYFRGVWLRRIALALVTMLALAVPATVVPNILTGLTDHSLGKTANIRDETILRWCQKQADRADVYLVPGTVGNHYLSKFFFKSKKLKRLHTAWPLPHGSLRRDPLLVSTGVPWWSGLGPLFGGRMQQVQLTIGPEIPPVTLHTWRLRRSAVAARRASGLAHRQARKVSMLVPKPGLYSFRLGRTGHHGSLSVAGQLLQPDRQKSRVQLPLAAGPVEMELRADGERVLHWLPPGERSWQPVPAGLLWKPLGNTLPRPPICVKPELTTGDPLLYDLLPDPSYAHSRIVQDILVDSRGTVITDLDRLVAKSWTAAGGVDAAPVLMDKAGKPLENPPEYIPDWCKELSLDRSDSGSWLLSQRHRTVRSFDRLGKLNGEMSNGLRQPLDLAEEGGRLYIADFGRKALLSTDARNPGKLRAVVLGVRPVAVDATAGRLAFLDQRRQQLVVRALDGKTADVRVQLSSVNRQMRLQLSDDGQTVVVDPVSRTVLLFDARGRLICLENDPMAVSAQVQYEAPDEPLAAHWDRSRQRLLVLVRPGSLVRVIVKPRP